MSVVEMSFVKTEQVQEPIFCLTGGLFQSVKNQTSKGRRANPLLSLHLLVSQRFKRVSPFPPPRCAHLPLFVKTSFVKKFRNSEAQLIALMVVLVSLLSKFKR